MFTSNPGQRASAWRRWTAAVVLLMALFVLGFATRLLAHSPPTPPIAAERGQRVAPEPTFSHVADPDHDVGPGEAECVLAQHPGAGGR